MTDEEPDDDSIPVETPDDVERTDAVDEPADVDAPEEPADVDALEEPADVDRGDAVDDPADVPDAVPPRVLLVEALAPVHDLCSRGSAVVGLPEPGVVAQDVLAMAPHERFETTAQRYADRLGVERLDAAGLERVADALPMADPIERATTVLARRAARLQGRALAQLARDPARPRDLLVLAVAADHLQRAAVDCGVAVEIAAEGSDDATNAPAAVGDVGDVAHLASIALAVTARLHDVVVDALAEPTDRDPERAARDDPLPDALVRDVALADHHRKRAQGDTPGFDPLDRDVDALRDLVVLQGAAHAVTELDADPGAVAELVDVPPEHVLGVLAAE